MENTKKIVMRLNLIAGTLLLILLLMAGLFTQLCLRPWFSELAEKQALRERMNQREVAMENFAENLKAVRPALETEEGRAKYGALSHYQLKQLKKTVPVPKVPGSIAVNYKENGTGSKSARFNRGELLSSRGVRIMVHLMQIRRIRVDSAVQKCRVRVIGPGTVI